MPGLRIGIDVGGTFTHGVVLKPPGEILATARTATTHTAEHGVAAGVRGVLADLLAALDERRIERSGIELVAHSTTQATNALLEGDVAPVARIVIVPPGELPLVRSALRGARLNLGGGHSLSLTTHFVPWEEARQTEAFPAVEAGTPVAVIQPLAGGHAIREQSVAEHYLGLGHPVVCASEITQVLGLAARARTAAVNASMLPTMLRTAAFTERAVHELLPGVPVQVVRSDGGAMSIDEMRRQPILSLLSGPAAGASAALDLSGLSEVVFIEAGGTSTDITLIKEGRVRHRYATVGGQRLMVPALDLRTVAVGGGSMPRVDLSRLGPRSAHIAGLPYLFQALSDEKHFSAPNVWRDIDGTEYTVAAMTDGSQAAVTPTELFLAFYHKWGLSSKALDHLQLRLADPILDELVRIFSDDGIGFLADILLCASKTERIVFDAIRDLARGHDISLERCRLIAGGGGAPAVMHFCYSDSGSLAAHKVLPARGDPQITWPADDRDWVEDQLHASIPRDPATFLIPHHEVISAIGAALAVTCASQSRTVAEPTGADIAELTQEVEQRLAAQGAGRVRTDYEYDPHRQVLTVTGRGSRAYEQDSSAKDDAELESQASELLSGSAERAWESPQAELWIGERRKRKQLACAQSRLGRCLWLGGIREWFSAAPGRLDEVLSEIVSTRTAYTDGGPALPGLALICNGRFIPLDALSSRELIAEVLRWENLPADAPGCFIIRA